MPWRLPLGPLLPGLGGSLLPPLAGAFVSLFHRRVRKHPIASVGQEQESTLATESLGPRFLAARQLALRPNPNRQLRLDAPLGRRALQRRWLRPRPRLAHGRLTLPQDHPEGLRTYSHQIRRRSRTAPRHPRAGRTHRRHQALQKSREVPALLHGRSVCARAERLPQRLSARLSCPSKWFRLLPRHAVFPSASRMLCSGRKSCNGLSGSEAKPKRS